MRRYFRPIFVLMAGILSMLAISACEEKGEIDPPLPFDAPADHTLLMYMEGDNNLSGLLENNVRQAHAAIRDSVAGGQINLLVYKDNDTGGSSKPVLYHLRRTEKNRLDTVVIRRWETEQNSADPDFMTEVINTAFKGQYDTQIKGLVLASHAAGWVPLFNHKLPKEGPRRSFGYDQQTNGAGTGTCDLWSLGRALLSCPKFDYIIMDCCHMGSAEVAYEMRDVTRYLLAGATETQGSGIPYDAAVTRLSRCKSANDLPEALDFAMHCYFDQNAPYNGGGKLGATIALYDLKNMDRLAEAYRQLLDSNAAMLRELANGDPAKLTAVLDQFQAYGREYTSARGSVHYKYYFWDLKDVIEWLGKANASAQLQALTALSSVVMNEYHDKQFWALNIGRSCGMGVTLPETLKLDEYKDYSNYFLPFSYSYLAEAYSLTSWGKYMGY